MKISNETASFFSNYVLDYYSNRKFNEIGKEPNAVVIKPTLKCVANCKHCEGRLKDFESKNLLEINEYISFFKDLVDLGCKYLCISGGEPLIYKDLLKLVDVATQLGLIVSINTNGWLLDNEKLNSLLKNGVLQVNLSLDSPDSDMHDSLRGLCGLFNKVTNLFYTYNQKREYDYILNIRMILSKYSYRKLPEMIDLAIYLNADILSIDMIENDYNCKEFLLNEEDIYTFNKVEKGRIFRKIETILNDNKLRKAALEQIQCIYDTNFNSESNYANGIYWPDENIKNKCTIPLSFMILEGDGSILPCNNVEYTRRPIVGNLKQQSIKQIWNNENWNIFRKDKDIYCRFCPMNMSHSIILRNKRVYRDI